MVAPWPWPIFSCGETRGRRVLTLRRFSAGPALELSEVGRAGGTDIAPAHAIARLLSGACATAWRATQLTFVGDLVRPHLQPALGAHHRLFQDVLR